MGRRVVRLVVRRGCGKMVTGCQLLLRKGFVGGGGINLTEKNGGCWWLASPIFILVWWLY
ncbi:hypothetical protein FRX31_019290 [Thalictrum thalictroides]|uniref:Uncharacterized protein n=1 Tax=Thalictrum thalictroides TaxID=46969 RepID=A0A7J6W3M1_THATH|nr:hypothetical protein FRX31_019290 [Thalictrum thalictroides]